MAWRNSIVVPTLGRDDVLDRALMSARCADPDAQLIIIAVDPSSRLRGIANRHDAEVHVQRGTGLAGAWSEGVRRARGDVVVFLNDDDRVLPDALSDLPPPDSAGWVGGAVIRDGQRRGVFPPLSELTTELALLGPLHFNRYFWQRDALEYLLPMDDRFHLVADRHLMLRASLAGLRFARIERTVYEYHLDAGSRTFSPDPDGRDEMLREHLEMFRAVGALVPTESRRASAAVRLWWLAGELSGGGSAARIAAGLREVLNGHRTGPGDLLMWFLRHHRRRHPVGPPALARLRGPDLAGPQGTSETP